jgi:hypothetical protein
VALSLSVDQRMETARLALLPIGFLDHRFGVKVVVVTVDRLTCL